MHVSSLLQKYNPHRAYCTSAANVTEPQDTFIIAVTVAAVQFPASHPDVRPLRSIS